ncbi:MAG: aldehyde ferredoxin oxidoreductase family protein [Dethiobacter sp.]|nr:aldehyde ferredoxin oxidoreductase family protein [Dethiobacter sp.]
MLKGYAGKILHVDLNDRSFTIEKPDEKFYRKYVGGACLGAYYVLKGMEAGIDALDPRNIIVFAISPTTGAAISGASRHCVTSKSPLTGTIASSEAGGYWGPELKFSGFDAIVLKGKAERPVYLWVHNGEVEIRDASNLWGSTTGEAQDILKRELNDEKIRVAQIGPAGENLVRYACITNELAHFNGRNGMGAVMGSKNLKAIAVRGTIQPEFNDKDAIIKMARYGSEKVKNDAFYSMFRELGTNLNVAWLQPIGGLPTKNWNLGVFEDAEKITAEALRDTYLKKSGTCWACSQSCKRVVELKGPYEVDPKYGGPEYETVGMCGSNLLIGDLAVISKINELCNKYGVDTISFGGTVGFAMECFEKGILTTGDTDGVELKFGNGDAVIKLVEMVGKREGFGNELAEGTYRLAKKLGPEAELMAVTVKGKEFPAHMPHVKASLAIAYACNSFGPDHQSSEHDPSIAGEPFGTSIRGLGFEVPQNPAELNYEKSKLVAYTQRAYSLLDALSVCMFCFNFWTIYNYNDLVNFVNSVTGWDTNLWELLRVGERRLNMFKAFNQREGFDSKDDVLPERLFKPLDDQGATGGWKIDKEEFIKARDDYYYLAGWDSDTGKVTAEKLRELGLEWVAELMGDKI